jgi:transcriptional regulator with XRE-family HTH domain
MNIPLLLRTFRRARSLTQAQAADAIGATRRAIESWEQGTRAPRGLALRALLAVLAEPIRTTTDQEKPCAHSHKVRVSDVSTNKTQQRKAKR